MVVAGTISDEVGTGAGPGVGSVIATGGGYVELDGVGNSFTGGVTVTGSGTTLAISDDANLGNGGTLALGSGTALELFFGAAPAYTITHTITVAGDAIFKLDHGVTATFAGVITDGASPGTVELTGDPLGAGTLVLANSNTYTGGTIIGSGTLEIEAMHGAGTGGITFAGLPANTMVKIFTVSGHLVKKLRTQNSGLSAVVWDRTSDPAHRRRGVYVERDLHQCHLRLFPGRQYRSRGRAIQRR